MWVHYYYQPYLQNCSNCHVFQPNYPYNVVDFNLNGYYYADNFGLPSQIIIAHGNLKPYSSPWQEWQGSGYKPSQSPGTSVEINIYMLKQ